MPSAVEEHQVGDLVDEVVEAQTRPPFSAHIVMTLSVLSTAVSYFLFKRRLAATIFYARPTRQEQRLHVPSWYR